MHTLTRQEKNQIVGKNLVSAGCEAWTKDSLGLYGIKVNLRAFSTRLFGAVDVGYGSVHLLKY